MLILCFNYITSLSILRDVITIAWRHHNRVTSSQSRDVITIAWRHHNCVTSSQLCDVITIAWRHHWSLQVSSETWLHDLRNSGTPALVYNPMSQDDDSDDETTDDDHTGTCCKFNYNGSFFQWLRWPHVSVIYKSWIMKEWEELTFPNPVIPSFDLLLCIQIR